MTGKIYHPEDKHPGEYQQDLNPDASKGLNHAHVGPHPEKNGPRTAFDIKEAYDLLEGFTDDDLKQIVVLPAGSRLEAGATYLDLRDPYRRPFTGRSEMEAEPENLYVPKSEVDYVLWNRLTGVTDPERLDQRAGSASDR
jgi:hypothetical protein